MLECEYCRGNFPASQIGLAEKMLHVIVRHPNATDW